MRGQKVSHEKKELARKLRREMTPEERMLWACVRGQRLGFKFRRQQVIHGFLADFYCHEAGLVVEVDGAVHTEQAEYDAQRTVVFEALGIEVLRFWNSEVTGKLAEVLERIVAKCRERVAMLEEPHPPTPSPKRGGGESPRTSATSEGRDESTPQPKGEPPHSGSPSPRGGGGWGVGSNPAPRAEELPS